MRWLFIFFWNAEGWHVRRRQHTVVENLRKSRIQHCERSELRLHLKCYQTGQNRTKISRKCTKFKNAKCDIFLVIFKHCASAENSLIYKKKEKAFFSSVWKSAKMSHLRFSISAFSTNFGLVPLFDRKLQVFQKLAKKDQFWHFWLTFVSLFFVN